MNSRPSFDRSALLEQAREAMRSAYAPYSRFPVGAALLTEDGRVFTGCNVENAAYPLSMCAERVAIGKAVSEGATRFVAIAVTAERIRPVTPCGACRQVLAEFGEMAVVLDQPDGTWDLAVADLLPHGFSAASLEEV
ncbi:cytidine deaminase [bacterium]|nr:cytidine deaminase [bacterium]